MLEYSQQRASAYFSNYLLKHQNVTSRTHHLSANYTNQAITIKACCKVMGIDQERISPELMEKIKFKYSDLHLRIIKYSLLWWLQCQYVSTFQKHSSFFSTPRTFYESLLIKLRMHTTIISEGSETMQSLDRTSSSEILFPKLKSDKID